MLCATYTLPSRPLERTVDTFIPLNLIFGFPFLDCDNRTGPKCFFLLSSYLASRTTSPFLLSIPPFISLSPLCRTKPSLQRSARPATSARRPPAPAGRRTRPTSVTTRWWAGRTGSRAARPASSAAPPTPTVRQHRTPVAGRFRSQAGRGALMLPPPRHRCVSDASVLDLGQGPARRSVLPEAGPGECDTRAGELRVRQQTLPHSNSGRYEELAVRVTITTAMLD